MKKIILSLSVIALISHMGLASAKLEAGYVNSTTVNLGEWNYNFAAVKAYSDAHHVPLLMFYGSTSCGYCDSMITKGLNSSVFRTWVEEHPICLIFQDKSDLGADEAKNFVKDGQPTRQFPYMKIYWPKEDGTKAVWAFSGRKGSMPSKEGSERGEQLVNSLNLTLGDYFSKKDPVVQFAVGNTEFDRLECEDATQTVDVPLVRSGDISVCSTNTVWANETNIATIVWQPTQTVASVAVAVNRANVNLALKGAGTNVIDSTTITYRSGLKPTAANPLWLGEKFGFGEWTCDIDGATGMVAKAEGAAYTLVSVQGSLWCPDCANTDRNFLDVTNAAGQNAFQAWAKAKNVALVTMDIPNYGGKSSTPTIFATNAYATTLARFKEWPASGAEGRMTNAFVRSGLGYLSRKGATIADATAVMSRFQKFASTDTDKGGFHRPEDTNKNRTGVPIFVLLRKDGSVAARFTRFAAVSPMVADRANLENYLKRFDEMLALAAESGDYADVTEIENNYPGAGAIAFSANGGIVTNALCNADMRDVFKLVGVGGNASQQVEVKGTTDAHVNVQFMKQASDGSYETFGAPVSGKLSAGITLSQTFTEGGEYFLLVEGANITNAEFAAASSEAGHFHVYSVSGSAILVPQGDQAKATVPAGSDQVTMRLVEDTVYCLSNVNTNDNPFLVQIGTLGAYVFVRSLASGDVSVKVAGNEICYQIWQPGQIAFAQSGTNVLESVNDKDDDWVEFYVSRTGGKSGRIKARVAIDTAKTTLSADRYVLQTNALNAVDFVWEDGVTSNMPVRVKIIDDLFYEGSADLVFNLEVVASDAGDVGVVSGKGTFTMTVEENDASSPGRGLIARTTPVSVLGNLVYARESSGAKLWVSRIEACDGLVAAELASSIDGLSFEMENPRDLTNEFNKTIIYWSDREMGEKYVRVSGIPVGETAEITLKSVKNFEIDSNSNTVRIVSVSDDAPGFAEDTKSFNAYRYVTASDFLVNVDAATLKGGSVTFKLLSGRIPKGLTATWDAEHQALAFTGAPTCKAGDYEAVYQISETRAGDKVPGLLAKVSFRVEDPTDADNPEANPSVAVTRTLSSIPVINEDLNIMSGLLQVTIPATGKISAKYSCLGGTIPFSSKSWGSFDPEDRALSATLSCRYEGYALYVEVLSDGSVIAKITDPEYSVELSAVMDWQTWSRSNPATDWMGYYTVSCPVDTNLVSEVTTNLASRGCGYLVLKMKTASAARKGKVSWAGMLPNGTSVSGSSTLAGLYSDNQGNWANLPIYKVSSKDVFTSYVRILAKAQDTGDGIRRCVLSAKGKSGQDILARWAHVDNVLPSVFAADMRVYGSYYDKDEDLGGCCTEYFQTNRLTLSFDTSTLGELYVGVPNRVESVEVEVAEHTMKIVSASNPSKVKLSFNRSSGIVSGSFALPYVTDDGETKTVSAKYKGVVLTGWGEGCGCGDFEVYRPFVNGSYYLTDKLPYESAGRIRTLSVKRGGTVALDVVTP